MRECQRSIFRSEAIRRYTHSRADGVVLAVVAPPTRRCLMVLAALIAVAAAVAAFTRVPVYVSGCAPNVERGAQGNGAEMIVLLPADATSRLRPGQPLLVRSRVPVVFRRSIRTVTAPLAEPGMLPERDDVATRLSSDARPVVLGILQLEADGNASVATVCEGDYDVQIEVGSRRAITMIPLVRRWATEKSQ